MKIIDEHGNEVDEGCLVEEVMDPNPIVGKAPKLKVVRIPDDTACFIVGSEKINGKVHTEWISFREKLLRELDFPEQAFHEVSKYDLRETRVADPVAFYLSEGWGDNTRVRIDFYKYTCVVNVSWSIGISSMCMYRSADSSARFNLDYRQEQSSFSGIEVIKQFILSTTNARYRAHYEKYVASKNLDINK